MAKLILSEKELLEYAWLGLNDKDLRMDYVNPLIPLTDEDKAKPHVHLLRLLRKPENLAFTSKKIFNIELMPFQLAVLHELFTRPFPLLIGSRGSSKTFMLSLYLMMKAFLNQGIRIVAVGSGFRQSRILFDYCERIWDGAPILRDILASHGANKNKKQGPHAHVDKVEVTLGDSQILGLPIGDGCLSPCATITYDDGIKPILSLQTTNNIWSNGKFRQYDKFYQNGIKPVYKLQTEKGYNLTATDNHQFKVLNKLTLDIEWKELADIQETDIIPIDRTIRWFENSNNVTIDEAYALGILIADGSLSNKNTLGLATQDIELVNAVNKLLLISPNQKLLKWCGATDKLHYVCHSKQTVEWLRKTYQIVGYRSHDKQIPKVILSTSKESCAAFIRGLFDGDGNVTNHGYIEFTNTSEVLINQLQFILLHFGIVSKKTVRNRKNANWRLSYTLLITGANAKKFINQINFGLNRKIIKTRKIFRESDRDYVPCYELMTGIIQDHLHKYTHSDNKRAKIKDISLSKLKKDKITRCIINKFLQRCEISGICDERIKKIRVLANPNIYYDKVKSVDYAGEVETYDLHVPDGHEYCANGFFVHNSGIRGLRANILAADEFQSNQREVFETVVSGFAAVSLNPVEKVKYYAKLMKMKEMGMPIDEEEAMAHMSINQTILAGTATYQFNHMYDYWQQYHKIIETKGNINRLMDIFKGDIPPGFNYKHFSIIRLPVELLPPQYVDQATIAKSKLTMMSGIFEMEFGSIFYADSPGFFKRSLIESCTTKEPIILHTGPVQFSARLRGDPNCRYVFGVDPASELDNFSIVILECWPDHKRVVYCWTINKSKYREKVEKHLIAEKDYYAYCARKIRDLMKVFPCDRIAMDSQGGGYAICEALHEESKLEKGERPLWQVVDEKKPKDEDDYPGLHIIQLCQFRDNMWTSTANHSLKKDFVDKALLFPHTDPLMMERYALEDVKSQRLYDGFEDCAAEIEEMKDEIASIVITITPTGNERWDTPDIKLPNGKKGKARKDRYSALLMANAGARALNPVYEMGDYETVGGFAYKIAKENKDNDFGQMYIGPDWFVKGASSEPIGAVVSRKGV